MPATTVEEICYRKTKAIDIESFKPLSSEGIKKLVLNAPNKTCDKDPKGPYLPRLLKIALKNFY